jgi:hypothetical protein
MFCNASRSAASSASGSIIGLAFREVVADKRLSAISANKLRFHASRVLYPCLNHIRPHQVRHLTS